MRIVGHKLVKDSGAAVPFRASPNTSGAYGAGQPKILVMHYTAGSGTAGSIDWLCNPAAPGKPSAHLVIGRDGAITQLVNFNVVANHAGAGTYKGADNMNGRAIGIELANAGLVTRVGSKWQNGNSVIVPDSKVGEAPHKYNNVNSGWEMYPAAQMDAAIAAAQAICSHFSISDICGHGRFRGLSRQARSRAIVRDVGLHRKRARHGRRFCQRRGLDGGVGRQRLEPADQRRGQSPQVARTPNSLPKGTKVRVAQQSGEWVLVHVLDASGHEVDTGWCFRSFLQAV